MKKLKKVLTIFSMVLLVVLTAVLLVRAVMNYVNGKKLNALLEKEKAEGVPMAMKDLISGCENSENAALLWKAAESLMILPEEKDRRAMGMAIQALFDGKALEDETRKKMGHIAEQNRRVLDLIKEAAALPCFKYGGWEKPAYAVERPDAIKMIQATRIMAIDAVIRAERGEVLEALDECRSGMRFILKTMDEPLLINNLVALADMKILLVSLNSILKGDEIAPENASAWMKELDIPSWRERFSRCVQGERLLGLEIGLQIIKGNSGAIDAIVENGFLHKFWAWLVRPIIKSEIIWNQNYLRAFENELPVPFYKMKETLKNQGEKAKSLPWHYAISGMLISDFRSAFLKEATLEAMMLATRTGLACRIFKNQHGFFPENLTALVPDILDDVPIDPFTGNPLVYRIRPDGLIIYSLGSNEKDDEGRGTYLIDKLIMDKDDDWAWREGVK